MNIGATYSERRARAAALAAVMMFSSYGAAQPRSATFSGRPTSGPRSRQVTPACNDLTAVIAESTGASPLVRAYALTYAAESLSGCSVSSTWHAYANAFDASVGLQDQGIAGISQLIEQLQLQSLSGLSRISEAKAEPFVMQARPSVRAWVLGQMIARATRSRKYGRATELLSQLSAERFPYPQAGDLILALPSSSEPSRQAIFRLAVNAASASGDKKEESLFATGGDLAELVVRVWKVIPPGLVLEAVDGILDRARASDRKFSGQGFSISLPSAHGTVDFDSQYNLKFVELLPVIRQLDPGGAERRLQDSEELRKAVEILPQGVLQAKDASAPQIPRVVNAKPTDSVSAKEAFDSGKAMADALALPAESGDTSPRANALLRVAQVYRTAAPTTAREALEELEKLGEHVPTSYSRTGISGFLWDKAIVLAAAIHEPELARSLRDRGLERAARVRELDVDADDPNIAPKPWWPSANLQVRVALAAKKISERDASETVEQMDDDDARTLSRLALAMDALGGAKLPKRVEVRSKATRWTSFGD